MLRRWCCQADISIVIEPVDPVLVKSGYATLDGADMVPVTTYRNGQRIYYLPGTSLKGVLRSQFERIARTLHQGSVCVPYFDRGKQRGAKPPVHEERNSYGCGNKKDDVPAPTVYADSCAACRMFGSLKFGGRFSIGDAYPMENNHPRLDSRNGVGIDRFTGGAVRGALFDLQALVGGKFNAQIRLTNYEYWQLGALSILLGDMVDGMIAVGSGRSRGFGRVRAEVMSFEVGYLGKVASLLGVGQLASESEKSAYGFHDWKPSQDIAFPSSGELRGLRLQYDMSADWRERLQPLVPAVEAFLRSHGGPQGVARRDDSRRGAHP